MNFFGFGFSFKRTVTTVFVCLSCLLPCFATFTLDSTFNGTGKLTISFPDSSTNYSSEAFRVYTQPSGRIIVGGSFTNRTADGQLPGVAWAGFSSGGSLDSSFGSGGIVTDWRSDAFNNFVDALMYADGSTLRMSQIFRLPAGSSSVSTARLNANGGVDNVYGQNAAASIAPCSGFCTSRPIQIAVRSDGKILAFISDQGLFLYRLNPDGTRDTTFGSNGIVPITFNKFSVMNFVEMIARSDGKILLVGNIDGSSEFFLGRLTETGLWDKTFGRVGIVRVPFGPGLTGAVRRALLQPDGRILLNGTVTSSETDAWMVRFRSNGKPDRTFGNNGVVIHDFAPGATDVATSTAVSTDGKVRLVGYLGSPTSFLVARFSATGTFEESTTIAFTPNEFSWANDVALQPDGKLLVVGRTKNPDTAISGGVFAIARLIE